MFKRIIKGIAVLLALTAVGGCSMFGGVDYSDIEGYSEVANAKTLYAQLDSGHFYMQDNSTGRITEEFTFMYRSDGNLMYSYMGTEGKDTYYEFHNGSEINFRSNDETEWSYLDQSSERYFVFNRNDPHPLTLEGVISVNAYAVTESSVEETSNGLKITFSYDPTQLAQSLSEVGTLVSFDSTLWLNGEGYCYRLDQKGVFNGGELVFDHSMFIDRMNEITELTRPEI